MASDTSIFFSTDDGAQSVTYCAPDGRQTTVTANVWDLGTETRDIRGVQTILSSRAVTFAKTDLSVVNLRGTVLIGSMEWAISRIIYDDGTITSLELQRHELHEQARPGYRRQ